MDICRDITSEDVANYQKTYTLLLYKGKIPFYFFKKLVELVDNYYLNKKLEFKGVENVWKVQLVDTKIVFLSKNLKVISKQDFTENDKRKISGLLMRLGESVKELDRNYSIFNDVLKS